MFLEFNKIEDNKIEDSICRVIGEWTARNMGCEIGFGVWKMAPFQKTASVIITGKDCKMQWNNMSEPKT